MDTLNQTLERHGLVLPDEQVGEIERFAKLLWDFNSRINLTRHTDWEQFVTRDLVDAIKLTELVAPDESLLDIGSGGGLPGILIAILRPDLKLTLCESVGKKARVLQQMVDQLDLAIEVYDVRAESLLEDFRYSVCTARAVGPLEKICRWFDGNWYSLGRLLAVKGPKWPEEKVAAEAAGLLRGVRLAVASQYRIPGQDWDSVILKIWPIQLPEPGPKLA